MPDEAPSADDLSSRAEREVSEQIESEVGPYNIDVSNLQGAEASALADLDKTYGRVLPYVQDAAHFVGDYYNAGIQKEGAIYDAAVSRLKQYFGTQAAYAQAVAQKIGGPVSLESFTAPLNWSMFEGPMSAAGGLLRANALAQGGVQEAATFAGKVFPLMNLEQKAQLRSEYESKISAIQKEINRIRSTASGRTQTRLEQLQDKERQYKLDQAKLELDRLNAERNWKVQQAQIANQKAQLAQNHANMMGYIDHKYRAKDGTIHTWREWTATGRAGREDERSNKAREDETKAARIAGNALTQQQITNQKIAQDRAYKHNKEVIANEYREAAGKYIDALTTPGKQTVTYTRYDPLTPEQAAGMNKNQLIPDGNGGWVKATKVVQVIDTPVISDPNKMYNFLTSHGVPPAIARQAIAQRFQFGPDWKPNKNDPVPGSANKPPTKGSIPDPNAPPVKKKYGKYGPLPETVVWDPKREVWYDTTTMRVWMKGHPPDKNGYPS